MRGRQHLTLLGVATLLLGLTSVRTLAATATNTVNAVQVEAAFEEDCERLVLREIPKARQELVVTTYIITRASVIDAICQVAERKVPVQLKYDERLAADSRGMKKALEKMRKAGVECAPVKFRSAYGKMHDKFVVIDRRRVLTGSYNFTTTASKENYENLVLIESPKIAEEFIHAFDQIHAKN